MLKRIKWPTAAIVFIAIAELISIFQKPYPWQGSRPIKLGGYEYYQYLPILLIHPSPSAEKPQQDSESLQYHFTGNRAGIANLGMATLYIPFFMAGHIAAMAGGYVADGFSLPYQICLSFTGLLYSLAGFIFLKKLLKLYFSDSVTAITLVCIGLGTNLFYYATAEGAMPHAPLFGLSCIFFYYTIMWHREHLVKYIFPLAITAGLVILSRPTNVVMLLFFALYDIGGYNYLGAYIKFAAKNTKSLITLISILFLFAFIQIAYWKYATGSWIYYPQTAGLFFFNHPFIFKGLFSYRKGWLVYTPIMCFSLAGIIGLKKYDNKMLLPMIFYLGILVYFVFSLWQWWYGGSFGARALIESYAFLAFPLAVFWSEVAKYGKTMALTLVCSAFLIYLNQFQTVQYRRGILSRDSMGQELYWKTFLKMKNLQDKDKYGEPPDNGAAKEGRDR